ncbi:hypothetical protein [Microbulbifer halophilus]|uniref:Uncharacterized protein n=1 Tax=Microbulbifer halophilus TaxID=453963 RepID=A0ABW5E767_9GAMM|nr:hypothetical protein [Microbulbifer halophilus]MCW8127260.1 hypothetical protein [Microbulbifer halophilus]
MARRICRKPQRRWRAYRASPLNRHRIRVRWLLAQRTRTRNYQRRFRDTAADQNTQ